MAKRRRREYLILLEKSKAAAETAIDQFNRVRHPYKNETTLILLANAWELLSKAVLVQMHKSIKKGNRGETISGEVAVSRLLHHKKLNQHQVETIQQIISLRHAATHHYLPGVPVEIIQHLLFFGCKFFRQTVQDNFPSHAKDLEQNYLSISFTDLTTYADRVQKLVSRVKKSQTDKKLVWLLERGIAFDGNSYITQSQFETKYRGKHRVMPYLALGKFTAEGDMVRIVPVEAPKNYTADINLRKGSSKDSSLPVVVKRTNLEEDYPYLTKEIGEKVNKSLNFVAKAMSSLGLKGDRRYHQKIRSSKSGSIQRYSPAALDRLRQKLKEDPEYDPYQNVA